MHKLRATLVGVATIVAIGQAALAQDRPTVALIPGLTTDAFYITMHRGAQAAAEDLGVELIYQGGPEFNPTVQIPVLQAVTARQPDAILIAPTDKQQLIAPLQQAHDAGIKVITVDTFIGDGQYQDGEGAGDFPLSYVASDNVLGGKMAGEALAKAIGGEGKVYVSNVKPGISTTDQREEGFKQAMQAYDGIEVLETQFNDDDANKAAAQLQAVYARNPDLEGVFGANLFSAIGAADGVKALGKSGEIKVVAFDTPTRIVDDIKSGLIDMAIAQHPYDIGYRGVETAVKAIEGEELPASIGTGFTVMDASNIDDPAVLEYVYAE